MLPRAFWPAIVGACVLGGVVSAQRPASPATTGPAPAKPAREFSGLWDYNDALSVDAASGRPEQAPQSATQRPRRTPTASTADVGGSATRGPSAGPGAAGGSIDEFERNMLAVFVAERRALIRDLLEVPELLRIRVTDAEISFTDDLRRERTYLTNNKMQKCQLGAAQFEARAYWDGAQFHKDIEGPNGFRMSEVYFLSDDSRRLFVVIRLGDVRKTDSIVGVNRVYDRVAMEPRVFRPGV